MAYIVNIYTPLSKVGGTTRSVSKGEGDSKPNLRGISRSSKANWWMVPLSLSLSFSRITASGYPDICIFRVSYTVTPSSSFPFEYFMQTIRQCSYFMLAPWKKIPKSWHVFIPTFCERPLFSYYMYVLSLSHSLSIVGQDYHMIT